MLNRIRLPHLIGVILMIMTTALTLIHSSDSNIEEVYPEAVRCEENGKWISQVTVPCCKVSSFGQLGTHVIHDIT